MWQHLKNWIATVKTVSGIEIILQPGGGMHIHAVTVTIKKQNIVKEAGYYYLHSIEELSQKISNKTPISLTINGKGILTKKITDTHKTGNPVQQVLPQSNPAEFYYQQYVTTAHRFISLARKEAADSILRELDRYGYTVLELQFGFSPINSIIPFLSPEKESVIITAHFRLALNSENLIEEAETLESPDNERFPQPEYLLGSQYLPAPGILSFAAATMLLAAKTHDAPVIASEYLSCRRGEYTYSQYFRAALWSSLTSLFVLLLFNFFLYSYYFNKNKDLHMSQLLNKDQLAKKGILEKAVLQKERFLQESGWSRSANSSFYADRIASLVPSDILLTSLGFFPVNSGVSDNNNQISFKTDTLQITGNCAVPAQLNQFINNIKNISSIKTVTVKNYQYKKELDAGSFFIEIIIR